MTQTTVKQRLIAFIKYKGLSQARFEKSVGVSNGFVNNISKGIGADKLQRILSIYPEINQDWLIVGTGSMLNSFSTQPTGAITGGGVISDEEKYEEALANGFPLLPEVDFKFAAGQTTLIDNSDNISRYWYLPDCKDCEGVAQVVGNSMSPALPSGCWVALKRHFFSMERANQIPFGNVFGVVVEDPDTGDYHGYIKVLRRYREQELSHKFWIAHSINESEFDDFDIDIRQVRSLWIVKQHIVSDTLL